MMPRSPLHSNMTATKPRFRFENSKGEHAYFLDDKPILGTTTVLKIIEKPLTWWSAGMSCEKFGWIALNKDDNGKIKYSEQYRLAEREKLAKKAAAEKLEFIKALTPEAYFRLLQEAYRAHDVFKDRAAVKGTDLHASLEEYIKAHMTGREVLLPDPRILPFIAWAQKNVRRFLFSEMCAYSEVLYCGGTADFGYEDMDGNFVLGDFKSHLEAYFTDKIQVGGYDIQISENGGFTAKGDKVFILTSKFKYYAIFCEKAGMDRPFIIKETEECKQGFASAISLYKTRLQLEGDK